MSTIILSLQNDGTRVNLVARNSDGSVVQFLETRNDIINLLYRADGHGEPVFYSSDIDFPEEYTADPAVLVLCQYLQRIR